MLASVASGTDSDVDAIALEPISFPVANFCLELIFVEAKT